MKYYDIDKAQELAVQNKDFVLGEHNAGRKYFEDNFAFQVKGRGKGRKLKLTIAETGCSLCTKDKDEEVIIVNPDEDITSD